MTKAKTISRTTKDGWGVIRDDVPIGKVYWIDPGSQVVLKHLNTEGDTIRSAMRVCVMAYSGPDGEAQGYMPLELLEIMTEEIPEESGVKREDDLITAAEGIAKALSHVPSVHS